MVFADLFKKALAYFYLIIIVLSIDNRVIAIEGEFADDGGGGGYSGGGTSYSRLRLNKIKVKQHKEDWHNGASELHFAGFKLSSLPVYSGDCGDGMSGSANCYSEPGKRIKKVSRGDIGDEFTANYVVETYTNSNNSNDIIFFVLFEEDSWPATVQGETFEFPNGEIRNVYYRSWQERYDKAMLSMNPNNTYGLPSARNYSNENSGIKYNLTFGY